MISINSVKKKGFAKSESFFNIVWIDYDFFPIILRINKNKLIISR